MSSTGSILVGDWLVEPRSNRLSRDGEVVAIEPRVMELLVFLAEHAGEVVSADDIFAQVWPDVVVGDNSLYRCIAQIRKVLGDTKTEPRYIATIPKRGYQLIAQVRALSNDIPAPPAQGVQGKIAAVVGPGPDDSPSFNRKWLLAGAFLVVAIAVGRLAVLGRDVPPDVGEIPEDKLTSIAVLPFTNVSGDPENDYFAIGLSDEILSTLGHVKGLDVVARTSSYSLEGTEDVREIGRRLNVQGVVEGGVRRVGDQVRVNAQLIDARSGYDLWAGEFDRRVDDVFEIQEEIAENILSALREQLNVPLSDDLPRRDGASFEAYDLYLLGRHYLRDRKPTELLKAVEFFREATARDALYAPAFSGMAEAYLLQVEYADLALDEGLRLAEPMLDRALALDPNFSEPYATLGLARFLERRHEEAQAALRTALRISPSHAIASMWLGLSLAYHQGRIADAQVLYERGLSLDPLNLTLANNSAYNLSRQGRYAEALELLARTAELKPLSIRIQLSISQAAADFGKFALAHAAAQRVLELEPGNVRGMTMMAYVFANLGDVESAGRWIARVEASGERTSHWHVNLSKGAVLLQEGRVDALAAHLESQIGKNIRPDPILFFSPRHWKPYAALAMGQLLNGDYRAAEVNFDRYREGVGETRITQTSEETVLFLTSDAYVLGKMGDEEGRRLALDEAETATAVARENGWNTNTLRLDEARLLALEGKADEAVAAVQDAVDQGYPWLWWLESDPIFAEFAEDDSFREILDAMRRDRRETLARINGASQASLAR